MDIHNPEVNCSSMNCYFYNATAVRSTSKSGEKYRIEIHIHNIVIQISKVRSSKQFNAMRQFKLFFTPFLFLLCVGLYTLYCLRIRKY